MGRGWMNFEVYYRKILYCTEEIVDRNMNAKGDCSMGSDESEEHRLRNLPSF